MNIKDCFYLGRIAKKFSFKGEVLLKPQLGNPQDFKKIKVLFVDVGASLISLSVEKISIHKGSLLRLQFAEITTELQAEALLKKEAYTPLELLPKQTGINFFMHEVLGFSVYEETFGYVGILTSINEQTPQKIFVIDAQGKEVLIPVNKDLIKSVDRTTKTLTLSVAEGLIDLYLV